MPPLMGARRRAAALAWILGLLGACSPGAKDGDDDGSYLDGGSLDTDSGPTDGGVDEPDGTWWLLDGLLVVRDGAPQGAETTLTFSRRAGDETTCQDTVSPSSMVDAGQVPHTSVFTWWRVEWEPEQIACFGDGEGASRQPILLGVGEMHPEIEAVLPSLLGQGDAATAAHLNGAYLQLPGDDRLLVFGAIGPEAAWAGEGKPATAAPLADGTWILRAAYSLPLTW